ncbi:DUF4131 domain-containing protein, partial [Xanthomonas translucens]
MRAEAIAPFGIGVAAALAAGVLAALWLPRLAPWPLSLLLLLGGSAVWIGMPHWRWLGAFALGFAWLGLIAGMVLARQLPADWEKRVATLQGQVLELPQAEVRRTRFMFRVDTDATQPAPLRGRLLQLAWYDDFGAHAPGPRTALHAGARWRLSVRLR